MSQELQIALVLGILLGSLLLFITEKIRMDVVALLVLSILAIAGLVTPEEALEGFSNPAVVTVWAMFVLSAGLTQAGVADVIGNQVLRLAGKSEARAILVIMLTSGFLSAFMNNIGVAALMLPVVSTIAKRTGHGPSRLLMPLAYGSLLGGLTTLIGTPPNLVASNALVAAGHEGFTLFDFTPVGVSAMLGGTLFVALAGRFLLPKAGPAQAPEPSEAPSNKLLDHYELEDRRFELEVPLGSPFDGKLLRDTGLGSVLGLYAYAIRRGAETFLAPSGDFRLEGGDRLQLQGRFDHFRELVNWQALEMASGDEMLELLSFEDVGNVEITLSPHSELIGLTARECDFRKRFGVSIIGIRRHGTLQRENVGGNRFESEDRLFLEGTIPALEALREQAAFADYHLLTREKLSGIFTANDRLLEIHVPEESALDGMTIGETRLRERLGLNIIGIARKGEKVILPGAGESIHGGDRLLAQGSVEGLAILRGLQSLEATDTESFRDTAMESASIGLAEATLSPRSNLVGSTLQEIGFRNRFGVQVIAIWRAGRAYGSHLRNMKLQFGDAFLLSGPREKLNDLRKESDFLVISAPVEVATPETQRKVLLATLIMAAVIVPVLLGWQTIAIAAVAGVVLMVLTRCLSIREAYRAIEWNAVFLIAGMIPLGTALQTSGAAKLIAEAVAKTLAPFGDWSLVIGLYLLTSLCTTIIPTTALVLLMAPIAIQTATGMGLSPQAVMMAIAMAASASFTSPISHPANVLVMGPGGYRFVDYVKLGVPLAAVVLLFVIPAIYFRWPLR